MLKRHSVAFFLSHAADNDDMVIDVFYTDYRNSAVKCYYVTVSRLPYNCCEALVTQGSSGVFFPCFFF